MTTTVNQKIYAKQGIINLTTCDLHYFQEGAGPDIIWVPGGDQTGDVFRAQFDAFNSAFRNTSYDPRGVGKTKPNSPPPWDIAAHAEDCAALIREVCSTPVIATGLSFGALIVQELALSYPELVRLAIPMGTGGVKTGYYRENQEAEIAFAAAGNSLPAEFAVAHYGAMSYPAEVLGDDELWEKCKPYLTGSYVERDPKMLAAQWQACVDFNSLDRLPDCNVPMHVIAFEQDLQTPPARGRLVAEAAANGHFHLLKGMGHFSLFAHKPDVVNECILSIIRQYGQE